MNEFRLSDSENSVDYEVYTKCEEIQKVLTDLMKLLDDNYNKMSFENLYQGLGLLNGVEDDLLLMYRTLKSIYH